MLTAKTLHSIHSIDDFNENNIPILYDISYRGGYLGCTDEILSSLLNIPEENLPNKCGVYCNYLGGGIRGAIVVSGYSPKITGQKKTLLNAFLAACKRAYITAEEESGLINETDEDGETNWNNVGTAAVRRAGTISAY